MLRAMLATCGSAAGRGCLPIDVLDVRLPSRGLTVSLGTDNRQPFAQIVASWARFDRAISRYIKPINGPPTQATTKNAVHEPAMASAARAMP